jgi:hypothetical protein
MPNFSKILKTHRFRKLKRIFDEASQTVVDVIRFDRTDGTRGRLEIVPAMYDDKRVLKGRLLNADAAIPSDPAKFEELAVALKNVKPEQRQVYLSSSGWSHNKAYFVVGRRVVGAAPEGAVALGARKGSPSAVAARIRTKGSTKGWNREIGVLARESSVIAFSIACAFAAPLLSSVSVGTICFVVFGPTRTGKSLATLAGASAVGFVKVADMMTWSIKDARLQELLPSLNDLMVPIEDLMTMSGTDSEKLRHIEGLAYQISSGRETERHSVFQRGARSWTTLIVTQSEHGVAALAEKVGRQRAGGSAMRTIDVPALRNNDSDIFDLFKKREGRRAMPEERAEFFRQIVKGASDNHGKPFIRYLEALIADREAIATAEQDMEEFMNTVSDPFDGDEARDLARKFGAVYVGGMRAIAYGVWDLKPALLLQAIRICYRRARAILKDEGLLLKDGLKRFHAAVGELPVLRAKAGGNLPTDAPGYRTVKDNQRRCVIKVEAFAQAFASVEQRRLVESWLIENGQLTLAQVKTGGVSKPKEQFLWPDGKRRRSFEIIKQRNVD